MPKLYQRTAATPRDVMRTRRRREHWLQKHERELDEHQAELARTSEPKIVAPHTPKVCRWTS